jgi:hypothetical protein
MRDLNSGKVIYFRLRGLKRGARFTPSIDPSSSSKLIILSLLVSSSENIFSSVFSRTSFRTKAVAATN